MVDEQAPPQTITLRAAIEEELRKASEAAGYDVGELRPASMMLSWAADGKVGILYGGRADPRFLHFVSKWITHAIEQIRVKRGGEIVQRMLANGDLFGGDPPKGRA